MLTSQIIQFFRQLPTGRSALVPATVRADVIHVMDKRRIMESGTHAQLVALGGAYAESWLAQMQEVAHA
jgi:ABC-type transport system involved in Fe-S cluster assembly fused permease/ATPase subunit